ncbi:MAG: hypothetical protein QM756_12050 [Polyangiaceae bacterium]
MSAATSEPATEVHAAPSTGASLPLLAAAGVLSGWSLVAGDACARAGWQYFPLGAHLLGSIGLYATVGAALGVVVAALVAIERALVVRLVGARGRLRVALGGLFYWVVGALASSSTAIWTFSGESVQKTPLAVWGPLVFAGGLGCVAAAGAFVLARGLTALERGGRAWMAVAALFFVAGVGVAHIDLTQYVSLYSRVHTILELIAALCFGACYALLLLALTRFVRAARGATLFGWAALGWLLSTLLFSGLRVWFDESLKHVWLEEVYVGRMLRRIQVAEAFLADPLRWRGMHWARVERLKARYTLPEPKPAAEWSAPLSESPERWDELRALRGGQQRYNVIVYYVDTLRSDVAAEADTMPALARFRQRSLDFRRAYAAGSDTLRSLPVLTGGNYDGLETPDNDLLRVAKRASYDEALAIAKSAFEFFGQIAA